MDKFLSDIPGLPKSALGQQKGQPNRPNQPVQPALVDPLAKQLLNYEGNFAFLWDLKNQFKQKGRLTERQWEAAAKCLKAGAPSRERRVNEPQTLQKGDLLRVGRFFAGQIGEKAGLVRPHFVFEVTEPLRETDKAVLVKLRCSGQKTNYCGVCGLLLTNPHSVALGIGPYCAKNLGLSLNEEPLEALRSELHETRTVETWLPKSAFEVIK